MSRIDNVSFYSSTKIMMEEFKLEARQKNHNSMIYDTYTRTGNVQERHFHTFDQKILSIKINCSRFNFYNITSYVKQ